MSMWIFPESNPTLTPQRPDKAVLFVNGFPENSSCEHAIVL
jgi:hypothetical protein